jgi:hypothetical protein
MLCLRECAPDVVERVLSEVKKVENVGNLVPKNAGKGHAHFLFETATLGIRNRALLVAKEVAPNARLI